MEEDYFDPEDENECGWQDEREWLTEPGWDPEPEFEVEPSHEAESVWNGSVRSSTDGNFIQRTDLALSHDGDDKATVFNRLIANAGEVTTLEGAHEILLQAKEHGLGAGQRKHLVSVISEYSGYDKATISAAAREVDSTIRGMGYVGTPDAASSAYGRMLDQDCPPEDDLPGFLECEDGFFAFDDESHYEQISDERLSANIRQTFKGHSVVKTDRDVREIRDRVAEQYRITGFFMGAAKGLPMANGFAFYDEATSAIQVAPHSRRHKARFCLGLKFSDTAEAPLFKASMRRLLPDACKRQAFQEVAGCVLFQVVPRNDAVRRMVILAGKAGSGKSTLIEIMKRLLPAHLVGNVPPASWKSEFARARLSGLRLNYCTELSGNKLLADDQVKQIVACETVTGRHRYGQEHEVQPVAFHMIATNALPQITDTSGAFDRRLLVLQFDQPLDRSEMDSDFLDSIQDEHEGIIAWAAEGAERLMARGYFELPPGHAEAMLGMKFGDDVVALFAHTQLERAPGQRVHSSELRAALASYAFEQGYDRVVAAGSGVMRRLSSLMEVNYGARRSASNNAPFYMGVALKRPPAPQDAETGLEGL